MIIYILEGARTSDNRSLKVIGLRQVPMLKRLLVAGLEACVESSVFFHFLSSHSPSLSPFFGYYFSVVSPFPILYLKYISHVVKCKDLKLDRV